MPGRETVALLLEEAMRCEGWAGGRTEERRRALDERAVRLKRRNVVREGINQALDLDPTWWGEGESDIETDDIDEGEIDEAVYVGFHNVERRCFQLNPDRRHLRRTLGRCWHFLLRGYRKYSTLSLRTSRSLFATRSLQTRFICSLDLHACIVTKRGWKT